jgi:hypothetical protein
MTIKYEFLTIEPQIICDEDDNTKTQSLNFCIQATDTTSHGTELEAFCLGEIMLSGEECVAPESLDVSGLLNAYVTENSLKSGLLLDISGQKASAHAWTGTLDLPGVSGED